jgi:hypothetical protein
MSFILRRVLWHTVKCYDMRSTALRPLPRKACSGFLSSLKFHHVWPGLNPRTLGRMTNTLTTRPQWTTVTSFCRALIKVI